jgi:hypothetical protein
MVRESVQGAACNLRRVITRFWVDCDFQGKYLTFMIIVSPESRIVEY